METLVAVLVLAFLCYVTFQAVMNFGRRAQKRAAKFDKRPALQDRRDFNPEDVRVDESRCFLLPVVGESHRNQNGTSRQEIIKRCSVAEPIQLVPEPENPYDSSAIKLCRQNGEQIGYLRTETAYVIREQLDRGVKFRTEIFAIHGGTPDKPSRGVVLRVGVLKRESTEDERAATGATAL